MEISFYEEFPTKKNLEKLKLIKFKTRLFVAAKSLNEFKKFEKQIKKIKKKIIVAYWPLVKNSYWISPFSNTKDLIELFKELDSIKNPLLIDLELPRKRIKMVAKNITSFNKNKKMIRNFLEKNKKRITSATETYALDKSNPLKLLGINYDINYELNPMYYTSMHSKRRIDKAKNILTNLKNKNHVNIGIGVIAIGILGNEPILSPKNLEKDLNFIKSLGYKKVTIFRLGGLNKEYIKVINKFTK